MRGDRAKSAGSRRRAYTLAELVTVIIIVGILAAVAIPTFGNSVGRNRALGAANRLAADLRYAAAVARQAAAPRGLRFDETNKRYTVAGINDPDRPGQAYVVKLADDPYYVTSISLNLGGATEIMFDGYGVASAAGDIRIAAGNRQVIVTVALDGTAPVITEQ